MASHAAGLDADTLVRIAHWMVLASEFIQRGKALLEAYVVAQCASRLC